MTLDDLRAYAEIPRVVDARVSADGTLVAYTVVEVDAEADRRPTSIWIASALGDDSPRRLFSGLGDFLMPRWSPKGNSLAFVLHQPELGWRVGVGGVDAREPQVVAVWPDEAIEDLEWSPNGKMLAFTARVDDPECSYNGQRLMVPVTDARSTLDGFGVIAGRRRHLFLIDVSSNSLQQITFGNFEDEGIAWSPDSQRIAFISARQVDWDLQSSADVWTVDISRGELTRIVSSANLRTPVNWGNNHLTPAWSHDGRQIARIVTPDQDQPHRDGQVALMDANGANDRILTGRLDRNARSYGSGHAFQWVDNAILFLVDEGGSDHIFRAEVSGKSAPEALIVGKRQARSFHFAAGTLAVVFTDATQPGALATVVAGTERTLVKFGEHVPTQTPLQFTAPNGEKGEVEAWVLPPAHRQPATKYPAILHVHGGPNYKDGYRYSAEKQSYAAAGYAVITSNPRGSTGYGERWARTVRGPKAKHDPGGGFGEPAFRDLIAVVDEAIRRYDFIDPERIAITGTSYGGFMTVWSLGSTDRFKAGVCVNSSINLTTLIWRGDAIVSWLSGQLGVDVLDDTAEVWANSPISLARNIQAPLLIMHAEEDRGCTIGQSEQLFTLLRFLRRTTEMVRFPAASHLLATPFQQRERLRLTLGWFDKHVRGVSSKVAEAEATIQGC